MKQLISFVLILFLLVVFKNTSAQKQNHNWYFGNKAAMQFAGIPPVVTPLTNSAMSTHATACISDNKTGDLLFYTTGERVWNKNHQLMPNGTKLQPSLIALNTLIVPFPNNPKQYFIFTIDASRNFRYSIVDMALDNNLGDIATKGTFVNINFSEAITAVKKSNADGYWLISKSFSQNGNSLFNAYEITKNGFNATPISSSVGQAGKWFANLKSNADGTKVVLTESTATTAKAQVFDFDNQTGKLSNPITLHKENEWDHAFGAAFSPDDTKLYITYSGFHSDKDFSHIVQYSGTDFSNWTIVATAHKSLKRFNDLQLGSDGKLYIDNKTTLSTFKSTTLDVIENPNAPALSISYIPDFIDFGSTRYINSRLPNFINDKSRNCGLPNSLTIHNSDTCTNDNTTFTFLGNANPADSVLWSFEDNNSNDTLSTLTNGTHKYNAVGTYKVTLDFFLCGNKKTFTDTVTIVEFKTSLGKDTVFCHNGAITLQPDKNGIQYQWNTGDTTKNIVVDKPGLYWVKVSSPTCSARDSIFIDKRPPILIDLGGDYTVCEHDTANFIKLDAGKGYHHYKWTPTGDTSQWIIVQQAGEYYVVVEDYRGCKGDDGSKVARLCNFDFYIPNAFTPNGDGINDVFMPTALDIVDLEFEIYNSWGERVFMTNNPQRGWDGTYKGKPCPQGAYLYMISFKGYSNKVLRNYNFKGNLSLLR